MAKFDIAIAHVLAWNGDDKINDRVDVDGDPLPDVSLYELDPDPLRVVYKNIFWDRIKGDDIDSQAIANILFDGYVHTGAGCLANFVKGRGEHDGAVRILQRIIGVSDDGYIGDSTLHILNKAIACDKVNEVMVYQEYKAAREIFYQDIIRVRPEYKGFAERWMRRIQSFPDL